MSKTKELGQIILQLHQGVDPEVVKEEFREKFGTVTSQEIMRMEQELVDGGLPASEIQALCDIHADVFNMSIEEIHALRPEFEREGHPVQVLKNENRAIEEHLEEVFFHTLKYQESEKDEDQFVLLTHVNELFDINKHYNRKEMLFFPLIEKYGYEAAPKVMWGVDDEIRNELKEFEQLIKDKKTDGLTTIFTNLRKRIEDMIFKEEMIMLPMIMEEATNQEWKDIAYDSEEIGYCLVTPKEKWYSYETSFYDRVKEDLEVKDQRVHFDSGVLRLEQIEGILNTLPIDITFIDEKDEFRYFNLAKDRIFVRSKAALGRAVQHCHPPRSVEMVDGILDDLKSGAKDSESFWLNIGDKFIHISYHAVRNEHGQYLGTLEVSHDINQYRELEDEKRLRHL